MSLEDKQAIDQMIAAEALVPIVPELLPEKGWGVSYCPDGDVALWALNRYAEMFEKGHGYQPCLNQLPTFGGPAACWSEAPFHSMTFRGRDIGTADEIVLSLIEGMLRIKNKKEDRVAHMAYMPHCSCGMCSAANVPVWQNFLWTVRWKLRVKEEFPSKFTNHKICPVIDYFGYSEAGYHPDGIAIWMMHRGNFLRLAERKNWS